ncbi:metallophosphoesterase [Aldersonia kunmingensis]|uniref:metallophosphoesterase n=1 Tax=Aldersonia kunmingensis TaxID=408066 RepID=UPI00082EA8D2|nr:metallophosphoesterase [Aldersonia kunmingensis]
MRASVGVGVLVTCLVTGFAAADAGAERARQAPTAPHSITLDAVGLVTEPVALSTVMTAGTSANPVLQNRTGTDEFAQSAARTHAWDEYPYLRYTATFPPGTPTATIQWQGSSVNLNDLALHAWNPSHSSWGPALVTARPSTPGGPILLAAAVPVAADGTVDLLIMDGPRADRSFIERNAIPDDSFADPAGYDFALEHFSDTQYVSRDDPQVYRTQTQWIADNADPLKIAYAMHTGDLVQSWIRPGSSDVQARREFEAASEAMRTIDEAGVPNGVLPGNHDNLWNVAGRLVPEMHEKNHALYNEFFGPQRYRDRPFWGGSVSDGDNSAHYDVLDIAGAKFLMLYIGYNPPGKVLRWAEDVLDSHRDRNVVIGTHYYLDEDGTRKSMGFNDIQASSGEIIWNRLVRPYDSVFLVLSGHADGQATMIERNVGDTDRTVVQMLADYQYFTVDGKRSTGFQRLLQFDLDAGTMAVDTHSPVLNSFRVEDHDPRERFSAKDGQFVTEFTLRADVPRAVSAG